MVKPNAAPLQIRLTEPVIYLRGPSTGADFRGRPVHAPDGQHAMVRGLLTLRLAKATRIRSITLTLEGKSRTEWPEGVGPKRTDTFEENECVSDKTVFFSAQDAIKDRAVRRSQSVDPGFGAQFDVDSDDDDDYSEDEAVYGHRGRSLPPSVLPRHSGDWSAFNISNGLRSDSPAGSAAPSRQVSTADLSMLRSESGMGLDGLRLDGRGSITNTPPFQAHQSPPISSHPSSILLPAGQASSRGRSPMVQAPVDMPRRASDRGGDAEGEWRPTTPTGEPVSPINFPTGADVGSASAGVRFQSDAELEAQQLAALQQGDDGHANGAGEGEDAPDDDAGSASEYHPINEATLACPTNAVTTPTETPPPGSPLLAGRKESTNGSVVSDPSRRTSASHLPSQSSSLRHLSPSLGPTQPQYSTSSFSYHGSANGSPGPPGGSGGITPDERGRQKHHKFSLSAALRGLSHDVKERVRHGSTSRPPSQPASRASSRTRGTETPRNFYAEDGLGSLSLSRRTSNQMPIRGAVNDLLPHSRPGRSSRKSSPARDGRSESRGRGRARKKDEYDETHNWKEFRKGVYNYPIAFQLPPDAPPTIHTEFGSVTYRLKASVVRVGALTSNLIEEKEVTLIAGPQEDDMEETENVIVERQWEDQMRYQIACSGKAFPIGGIIPISIRLMPLAKVKVYRISVSIEEKTDYFAMGKKVARHETPRKYILFAAKNNDKKDGPEPLLPILSEASNAAEDSPLAPLARAAALNNPLEFSDYVDPIDNVYASLLDPMGPWHLEKDLHLPDCSSRIKFTTKHEITNISVGHCLKVTIRVERGDDKAIDSKGRRKQFDIIIETPIKILDCRVNTAYNSLPSYERLGAEQGRLSAGCSVHAKAAASSSVLKQHPLVGSGTLPHAVLDKLAHPTHIVHKHEEPAHPPHGPGTKEHDDTLLERNIVYDRLVSGQETETGEEPPTYKEAVAHAIRSASRVASRSHSRVGSPIASRANSRAPSRSQSRAPSRMPSPTRGPSRNTSSAQLYIAE